MKSVASKTINRRLYMYRDISSNINNFNYICNMYCNRLLKIIII